MHFLKRLGKFLCRGSDGRVYAVDAYQECRRTRTGNSVEPVRPVIMHEGKTPSHVDKGRYCTPDGLFLSADDMDAP
jgi:hypothetical protein